MTPAVKAATRVESFEELVWSKRILNGGAFYEADAGDALLQPWEYGACAVMGADRRFKYDLPDLATAKRAAWHLLLDLRAKAAPVQLATNLPAPNPLTPAELAEATAEGRACREALDRATVGMEGGHVLHPVMTEREIVICSAIRLPDGRIFRGHRHSDCIRTAKEAVEWNRGDAKGVWTASMCGDQGFITSRNRYVGREEGLALQQAAGIASACPSGYRTRQLFSEDLY
jgi:hypothetical protein